MIPFVALSETAISVDDAIARVRHSGAGGIALFIGVVRDESDGKVVTSLEYEAYGAMALAEMRGIVDELTSETTGVRLSIVHRTGALAVGDIAVVCAASAPHRAEAFRACRELIDRVKARAPIWKREHGPGGAHWVGWESTAVGAGDPR
jgi:molybdopterin synthase catalytic subunit